LRKVHTSVSFHRTGHGDQKNETQGDNRQENWEGGHDQGRAGITDEAKDYARYNQQQQTDGQPDQARGTVPVNAGMIHHYAEKVQYGGRVAAQTKDLKYGRQHRR
jgi:hypothetical protein